MAVYLVNGLQSLGVEDSALDSADVGAESKEQGATVVAEFGLEARLPADYPHVPLPIGARRQKPNHQRRRVHLVGLPEAPQLQFSLSTDLVLYGGA